MLLYDRMLELGKRRFCMLMASSLRAVTRVVGCGSIVLGTLILQGCGEDDSTVQKDATKTSSGVHSPTDDTTAEAIRAAQAHIYAELDAKFPDGMPLVSTPEERGQDAVYMAQIAEAQKVTARLHATLQKVQAEADHFKAIVIEDLRTEVGREPNALILNERLSQSDHYQKLLAAVAAAQTAVDENQQVNMQLITERERRPITEYETLKATADATAVAAGIPVRVVKLPDVGSQQVVNEVPAPKVVPTVEDLSKETGIPLAPTQL